MIYGSHNIKSATSGYLYTAKLYCNEICAILYNYKLCKVISNCV